MFDGLDAASVYRTLVGDIANEEYTKVHLSTNLLESFFHQANRSSLLDYLNQENSTASGLSSITAKGSQDDFKVTLNKSDIVALATLSSLMSSYSYDSTDPIVLAGKTLRTSLDLSLIHI